MDTHRLIAAELFAVCMDSIVSSARFEPPPAGTVVSFSEPMVVCKTKGELKTLVGALRVSVDRYDLKIKQLGVDRNECDLNTITSVISGEAEDVGEIRIADEPWLFVARGSSAPTKEGPSARPIKALNWRLSVERPSQDMGTPDRLD
jgi:hypothetical protein